MSEDEVKKIMVHKEATWPKVMFYMYYSLNNHKDNIWKVIGMEYTL